MNAKNQRALELACATLELEADAIRKMRDRLAQGGQSALLLLIGFYKNTSSDVEENDRKNQHQGLIRNLVRQPKPHG